ncbi:MAG: poly-beta-1,6-N-acetyl-D-glucosamine biosynthesis protein PgaD [Proteobacteria bacterium]|nr:poly-beta-1,6-N-acetyl-D-glucosamine biosynthesis protein PgaD [Pseudomonadota bacterium]
MTQRLIINARKDLSWRRRLLSDAVTALLWIGWFVLWFPVLRKLYQAIALHRYFASAAIDVLDTLTPISLPHALLALIGTSALLMLWSLLPTRRLMQAHVVQTLEDYADYFDLDEAVIAAGQASRVCVIHHDEEGRIVAIDPRGTATRGIEPGA